MRSAVRRTFGYSYIAAFAATGAFAVTATWSVSARAVDTEFTSDTSAQFYDVRSPTGETVLNRRRLTTTLGVSAYDLLPRSAEDIKANPLGPELNFRARVRYDADYGSVSGETSSGSPSRFVPGFDQGPVDLMYGYIEGRRFAHGWLDFKLGRQYVTDALGWWSFDGGEIKVVTPAYFSVELYGGLEQRGGFPLSTGRYESDGAWRGDRTGYDTALYPSFAAANVAPAFGVALESAGLSWVHGRLTYRRVYNTGSSLTSDFANPLVTPVSYDGTRISSEKIGYSVDGTIGKFAGVKGGFAYDLYNVKMSNMYASVDAFATQKLTVSLDYDYYSPTFDADSIFNFFNLEPMNDFGVRADYRVTDKLSLAAGGHARLFRTDDSPINGTTSPNVTVNGASLDYFPGSAVQLDGGGNLAARYKWGEGVVGLRGNGSFGSDGDRVGADIYGERTLETRFLLEGRASVWQWDDKLRPDQDATSVGYVAGLGYRFLPRNKALIEWEHNANRIAGQRFRLMLMLTLAAVP